MELSINFSTNLRMLRKRKNMTQSDLAKNLNYSEKAISKWERGGSIPPIDTLFDIARILETTVDALFSSQDRYYLAIDGGGSKTALLLADQDGRTIRTHRVTACNPIDIGIDKACAILSDAISTICEGIPKSNLVAFAGIAGGTSADMREKLHSFLAEQGFAAFDNDSDSKNIIAAGLGARDGIAMIMGTGICAFKYQGGEVSRVAGRGYLIDDGGSGYMAG